MNVNIALQKLFIHIYAFLFIFNPTNFFRFNLVYLLFLTSLLIFLMNSKVFIKILFSKRILALLLVSFIFFMYLSFFYTLGSPDALLRAYSFILIAINVFCSIALFVMYQKVYSVGIYEAVKLILSVGAIQIFFVLLALFVPEFRDWTLSTARQEEIYAISNDLGSGIRSFGLSSGYTSTFPMFMGICSLFSIYCFNNANSMRKKTIYLLLILLFLLSVIINARIGLIPIIIWIILSPLYFLYRKNIKILAILLFISFFGIPYIFVNLNLLNNELFFRLNQGYEEILNLLAGNKTGTFETLSNMWFFPENSWSLLFGQGMVIIGAYSKSSDIGFIQDIYMYGLIPTLFLLLFLTYFCLPLIKSLSDRFGFLLAFVFVVSLLGYYMKGMTFYANEVINLLLFLSVVALSESYRIFQVRK